jgi:hypothetical protein
MRIQAVGFVFSWLFPTFHLLTARAIPWLQVADVPVVPPTININYSTNDTKFFGHGSLELWFRVADDLQIHKRHV